MFLSGQSHPGSFMKSSRETSGCLWGYPLPWVSSQVFTLIHSMIKSSSHLSSLHVLPKPFPESALLYFFPPNLFPPGTRQGVFDSTLSLSCICQCRKLWFNRSHITGWKLALLGPFHGEHAFCFSLSLLSNKNLLLPPLRRGLGLEHPGMSKGCTACFQSISHSLLFLREENILVCVYMRFFFFLFFLFLVH